MSEFVVYRVLLPRCIFFTRIKQNYHSAQLIRVIGHPLIRGIFVDINRERTLGFIPFRQSRKQHNSCSNCRGTVGLLLRLLVCFRSLVQLEILPRSLNLTVVQEIVVCRHKGLFRVRWYSTGEPPALGVNLTLLKEDQPP